MEAIFAHFPAADFTVFMGDMNYRVDLHSVDVRQLAAAGKYSQILAQCQMNKVMQIPDSPFAGFSEAPIRFAPSYSYDVGTDDFDSSSKQRIPSYCDRLQPPPPTHIQHIHTLIGRARNRPRVSSASAPPPQDPVALQRASR